MFDTFPSRSVLAIIVSGVLLSLDGPGSKTVPVEHRYEVVSPELTLELRLYPEERLPGEHCETIRVRLDADRLRAYGLSIEDVKNALAESRIIWPGEQPRPDPPPGVVFVSRRLRPESFVKVIVRADPEGNIVRIGDIARVDRQK
jgi:HAE1 family hydrophobic/amphiphilic exporter-1